MKILDAAATKAALPFAGLIDALDRGFRAAYEVPLRHHHTMPGSGGNTDVLLLMPAWHQAGFGGVKIVNVVPGNSAKGIPAVQSSYILFDRDTGVHLLLLDGGELTSRRTAAASALAARRLARPDSSVHLVIGTGKVGQNLPGAYREALPIKRTLVYNINPAGAQKLAASLRDQGMDAQAVTDLKAAVAEADVISCATLTKTPLIKGEWLRDGQHIDLIGSFMPDMREADDAVIARATVYVDTEGAIAESGDIIDPIANGTLKREAIAGTLENLCKQDLRPRQSDKEITLFKSVGSAIEDLSAAAMVQESMKAV